MAESMDVLQHLNELRMRLIIVILSVAVLSIATYPLTDEVIVQMKRDVLGVYENQVIVTTPMEAVMVRLKLSILLGAFISVPLGMYELFSFVVPALHPKENKLFLVTLFGSFILFVVGMSFSYFLLLPLTIDILLGFAVPIAQPMLILDEVMSFVILFMAVMGLIFQWPLVVGILSKADFVSHKMLAEGRAYAVLGCFIVSALITADTTFVSQIFIAIPMVLLYEVGIVVARIVRN